MTKNQQSLTRAIKRGNAVIAFDNVSKTNTLVFRKGSTVESWKWATLNRNIEAETKQINGVTKPLSQMDIENSTETNIFKL